MPSKRKNEDASAESDDDSIDTATTALTPAAQLDDGTWPRMPAAIWGERTEDGNYRNDNGELDEDGLWRYHSSKRTWIRDRKAQSRQLRKPDDRDDRPEHNAKRGQREEKREQETGARRESRGPGGWGSAIECEQILAERLPHVVQIAMTDPVDGPFHWPDSCEAAMVRERDAVMQRLAAKFGPLKSLSSLSLSKPNVNSLCKLVDARNSGRLLLICDTETHRDDDSRGNRWKAGDVYDIAVTCVDWNGQVLHSKRWLDRWGKLSKDQIQEVVDLMKSRPDMLLCCWGNAEFKLFKKAGRKPSDGSDGIDVREAVLQVLPGMRNLANAVNSIRFSLSMNLMTPVFGMRGKAYHTALKDCEAEAVVITAFIRYIARQQPSTSSSKKQKCK